MLIYSEYHRIHAARDGVNNWLLSTSPAILKCTDWNYKENDYSIDFKVIATEDRVPYNLPYQAQYSGKDARIILPEENANATKLLHKVRIITEEDLPLFINYYHKTDLYSRYFK
jgi:hypothetical protein